MINYIQSEEFVINLHKFENGEPLDYTTIQFVIEQDKNLLDKVEKVLWLV